MPRYIPIQRYSFFIFALFFSACSTLPIQKEQNLKPNPGFLVVAPDRGFLGNLEIQQTFKKFSRQRSARLVFVDLKKEFKNKVDSALDHAVAELRGNGTSPLVVIPLVLFEDDPYLKRAVSHLKNTSDNNIRYAAPMTSDFRAAQILEDQIRALSKNPAKERLVRRHKQNRSRGP